jgi:hypothetical protein
MKLKSILLCMLSLVLSATPALTQTPSTTPNLQLSIPADGELDWGPLMETDLRALDAILGGTTAAPWSILTSTPYHITNSTNHTTLFTVGMDGSVLTLGGGTFGGPVVLPADPTSPMQASTKQYVDNKTANALSTGTALKATSLAATPTGCDPGMVSNTFDAQGNATNCFTPAGSGSGGTSGTIVASPFKHKPFYSATGDSGTTLSADTGAMTDGNGNETAVSLSANNPHIALQYKQAHSFNSSDYQQCQADGGGCTGGDSPFNFTDNLNIRHPGGGGPNSFNIFLNANSGWENNSNILVNYNAFQVTGNFHTPGQVGGLLSTSMNQMSAGDGVLETTAGFGWGCGRGEDECLEPHRDFYAFFDANFGGLLTLGTPDVAGHQPMTLQAFGGYNTFWIGEQNVLMDVSKRTQLGNVIGGVSTDGGAFLTLTLDAPHNMGVSTITQLTRAVDATAYNGVCGAQTATGGVYSFIEPNVGQDGFSTLSNGLGTPGENANYSFQNPSYPDGTLLGVCVQVASTAGLAAGTEVEFSHFFMDNEYTPVIQVYDATHFTAFMHHPHDIGTTVSWGGGVGLGFGMNADERTPGFNDSVQDAQSSVLRLVYPIVYTSDSTHVTIWTNAEQSNGTAEFKTLGRYTNVPQQATSMALTVTNGVVTSFVQDGDGIPNNYIAAEVGAGAAPNLPLGPIVYGGSHACTTNPVWAFEPIDDQNELTYIAQLVSGGSGCPSDLTMTIQPYPNQAYTMPATWIYRDVDPSNGQVGDGYLLALAIDPTKWSNGDEVAQGMWWGRYNSEKKFLTGDPIVGHSARFGISNLETYAYMQSGQPYKQLSNFTPASYYFGQFINGVRPTPPHPRRSTPALWMACSGICLPTLCLTAAASEAVAWEARLRWVGSCSMSSADTATSTTSMLPASVVSILRSDSSTSTSAVPPVRCDSSQTPCRETSAGMATSNRFSRPCSAMPTSAISSMTVYTETSRSRVISRC